MAAVLIAVLGGSPAAGQIENFAAAMLKAKDCIEQNYVLARTDSYTDHDSPGKKPWSVNWQTYGGSHPDSMPYCAGTDTLLESLKNGVRVPPEGISITNDLEMRMPLEPGSSQVDALSSGTRRMMPAGYWGNSPRCTWSGEQRQPQSVSQ